MEIPTEVKKQMAGDLHLNVGMQIQGGSLSLLLLPHKGQVSWGNKGSGMTKSIIGDPQRADKVSGKSWWLYTAVILQDRQLIMYFRAQNMPPLQALYMHFCAFYTMLGSTQHKSESVAGDDNQA